MTTTLVALGGAAAEPPLLAAFARPAVNVTVVRRCVDVAELLAAATAGTAAAALVAGDLRRLDAAVVTRLAAVRVGVVALAADEATERVLRSIGIGLVLPMDADAATVGTSLAKAAAQAARPPSRLDRELADPAAALEQVREAGLEPPDPDLEEIDAEPRGRIVAVWGTTGAPGRTLLATTLAAEAAALGASVLLIDADTYGASVAQSLGLLDEAPGLAAAIRAATTGTLDIPALAGLARAIATSGAGQLRVLTGLPRSDRWPELRPSALERVLHQARRLATLTVVDCGFCLETDEELTYDSVAPRRNGATLTALGAADVVLAVGAADPVALSRLVQALPTLAEVAPDARRVVVINRVRRGPVGGDVRQEITRVLDRYAGVATPILLPEDRPAVDAAMAAGRLLSEHAPLSPYRAGVRQLAADLLGHGGAPPPTRGLHRLLRRRQ